MKKERTQWSRLLAILTMLALLASACGSSDNGASASDPADSTDAETDASSDTASPDEGTGSDASGDDSATDEHETLSLNVGYIDTSLNGGGLIAIAEDLGLFEKYNLEVNLIPFTNGPTQIQAMQSGDIDVGYVGGGAIWLPASGQATVLVTSEASIGERVIASSDSGATDMEGLRGMKVGVPEGGSGEMILALALEQAGMTMDDIEPVVLDPPNIVTAFVSGSVDAAAIFQPLAGQILTALPESKILAQNSDFAEVSFLGAWVASNPAVDEKPDALIRFLMVYADANDFRVENFEEALEVSSAFTSVPMDSTRAQGDFLEWYSSEDILQRNIDGTTAEQFEGFEAVFVSTGRMEAVNPAESFINNELFAAAMAARS